MTEDRTTADLEEFLARASIDDTVAALRPDYRAFGANDVAVSSRLVASTHQDRP